MSCSMSSELIATAEGTGFMAVIFLLIFPSLGPGSLGSTGTRSTERSSSLGKGRILASPPPHTPAHLGQLQIPVLVSCRQQLVFCLAGHHPGKVLCAWLPDHNEHPNICINRLRIKEPGLQLESCADSTHQAPGQLLLVAGVLLAWPALEQSCWISFCVPNCLQLWCGIQATVTMGIALACIILQCVPGWNGSV